MIDYSILPEQRVDQLRDQMRDYRRGVRRKIERDQAKKSKQVVSVDLYADMLKVRSPFVGEVKARGVRGECKGFSDDSRRRLIQKMAMWNLNGLYASFLTLTYPGAYVDDWHIWKRDLEAFFKRLTRRYPEIVGAAWRVEFQKRGAPHFHLIVATSSPICSCQSAERRKVMRDGKLKEEWVHKPGCSIHQFRAEIALAWPEIVREGYRIGGGDMGAYSVHYERNKHAGTGVESVQNRRQMMAYVSKYLAKTDQAKAPDEWGRSWGFRNVNGELDFSPVETIEMDYTQAVALRRLIKRWLKSKGRLRYSKMLNMRASYSVLGLGSDSENERAAYRMLGGVSKGLFAPHNTPGGSGGAPDERPFIERVAAGLVTINRPGLVPGSRVETPYGLATISSIVDCPILKRRRCSVITDQVRIDGSHFAGLDLWQVRPVAQVKQAVLL